MLSVNVNILFVVCLHFILGFTLRMQGWDYINLHCRDNNNSPVDWWYIYKPPSDVVPFFELGRNFTFITPDSLGRWEASDKYITSNSMLQYTLAPIFRPTYVDHLAVAIYDERDGERGLAGSVARGVLMADEEGGVWIYHTVPGLVNVKSTYLPDKLTYYIGKCPTILEPVRGPSVRATRPLTDCGLRAVKLSARGSHIRLKVIEFPLLLYELEERLSFPEKESANGHLLMCLSLDLEAVNAVVYNLRNIYPKLSYLKVSDKLLRLLPEWRFLETPLVGKNSKPLKFVTSRNDLLVEVLVRAPGDTQSIYERFASSKNIVLDVYGQSASQYITSICSKKYSVRNIENISVKLPESVMYLRNKTDRMWFAVSTAAHWQTQGSGPKQHWACISNLDKENKIGIGGDLLCVENYRVWHAFDNLKVSEPNNCIQ